MSKDKTQDAGNGWPFSSAVTPDLLTSLAPSGRARKRSSTLFQLLPREHQYLRVAPRLGLLLRSTSSIPGVVVAKRFLIRCIHQIYVVGVLV